MVGFRRLFAPWSKIACSVSRASFFVFHASLFASARIVVPLSRPSISTRGNKSSSGSPAEAAALFPAPVATATLARSADVRLGSGAAVPSTFSNSPRMVVRSCGFRSSRRSLIAKNLRQLFSSLTCEAVTYMDPRTPLQSRGLWSRSFARQHLHSSALY